MHHPAFLSPLALPAPPYTGARSHALVTPHARRRAATVCTLQEPTGVDVATPAARVRLTPTPVELVEAPVRDGSLDLAPPAVYAPDAGCDLSALPVLSPCAALPSTKGAYALLDAHGVLLAVGCAPDVSARVARHVTQRNNVAGVKVWAPLHADDDELEAACEYWLSSARELTVQSDNQAQAPPGAVGRKAVYGTVLAVFALHAIAKQAAWFMH